MGKNKKRDTNKKRNGKGSTETVWDIFEKYPRLAYIVPAVIIAAGVIVRLAFIGKYPLGLNQDEASAGYESFALLKYGTDRNGIANPVHLIAWGSGQNIAYSWICMPFIAVMGLSAFSVRLPMAIIGCVSVAVMYFLLKNIFGGGKKYVFTGAFLFAVFPWHIMKSRWGLESNIFPDLILWAAYMLSVFLKGGKPGYLYAAFVIMGFSAYSYGTSYCFLPFFAGGTLAYMYISKKINVRRGLVSAAAALAAAFPMILFVMVNTFGLPEIKFGFFTIPRLYVSRHTEMASVFSDSFIKTSLGNFLQSLKILIVQEDGLPWNSMKFYGINYVLSLPLTVWGIICSFGRRNTEKFPMLNIMNIWFLSAAVLLFTVTPNINRINIIMPPVMFYTSVGAADAFFRVKYGGYAFAAVFTALFVMFAAAYFTGYQERIGNCFFYGLEEAVRESEKTGVDRIYVSSDINAPYIFELFYNEVPPEEYIDTVNFSYRRSAFEKVDSFGKYVFGIPAEKDSSENAVYIASGNDMEGFVGKREYRYTSYGNYVLVRKASTD